MSRKSDFDIFLEKYNPLQHPNEEGFYMYETYGEEYEMVQKHIKEKRNEYLIVTDEEAEEEWENNLDNYIEECVLPELPKQYRYYFDEDSFKRDCKYDGRGHSLASYDGRENEEIVENIYYYIYRIN